MLFPFFTGFCFSLMLFFMDIVLSSIKLLLQHIHWQYLKKILKTIFSLFGLKDIFKLVHGTFITDSHN